MNERINQLIKQSYVTEQSPIGESYTYFSQEKFAELIVRECCDVLYDNELGGYQVNYVLKEHFGVE